MENLKNRDSLILRKGNFKILRLYIISFLCIVFFIFTENSNIILELVEISSKGRYGGFVTFLITGFFKYGLLFYGIFSILFLTIILIRNRNKKI